MGIINRSFRVCVLLITKRVSSNFIYSITYKGHRKTFTLTDTDHLITRPHESTHMFKCVCVCVVRNSNYLMRPSINKPVVPMRRIRPTDINVNNGSKLKFWPRLELYAIFFKTPWQTSSDAKKGSFGGGGGVTRAF